MEAINDPLWDVAIKRTKFKKSLISYCIIIPFLWAIWYITAFRYTTVYEDILIPWPAWATLGWGVGLAFKFSEAYVLNTRQSIEAEYNKLKNQHN